MKRTFLVLAAIVPVVLLRAHLGIADVPATCDAPHALDKYKLLRRLSLDLRQRIPSVEEYAALDGVDTVPDATVQGYLASDEFRLAMRRHHENQLWPNISNVRLGDTTTNLTLRGSTALSLTGRENLYRSVRDTTCDDTEQKDFDPAFPGEFRPINVRAIGGERHEGYRMVNPYWAPTSSLKVCAYDAQETLSVIKSGKRIACNTPEGRADKACGCGPNLQFCYGGSSANTIENALREQLGRAADKVATGKAPYTDLILAQDAEQNGPVGFWRKNLAPQGSTGVTFNAPLPGEALPERDFADDAWKPLKRSPLHAGVLTMPAYLLRFQTDRGRANHFRIAFMGQYFVPAAKLEPQQGCSDDSPDLTKRCNCQYCHQTLEPLAAHFGSFSEAGSAAMNDTATFPLRRPECVGSTSAYCTRFYVTRDDAPRPGWLLAYQFAAEHPDYVDNIEKGPRKLAQAIVADGTFARSVVKAAFLRLMKRELRVEGEHAEDLPLLDQMATDFAAQSYDYPRLIARILSLPEYRRVR